MAEDTHSRDVSRKFLGVHLTRTVSKKFLVTLLSLGLIAAAGSAVYRAWKYSTRPLGPGPTIRFPPEGLSQPDEEQFLRGEFTIIKDVRALPLLLVKAYTEGGGSRLVMANPGENFNPSDVIYDASVPRMRLILAGVFHNRCFVHYESGGIAHEFRLAFFRLTPPGQPNPYWRGLLRTRRQPGQTAQPSRRRQVLHAHSLVAISCASSAKTKVF